MNTNSRDQNKKLYDEFCLEIEDLPIFMQPWWLDCVCGEDNWDVVIVEKGGNIQAVFPYYKTKSSIKEIKNPKLTPRLGPFFVYPKNQKRQGKLSFEKKVVNKIVAQLPQFDYFCVGLEYSTTNWLPWYWNEFKQTTRYSYVLKKEYSLDEIWSNIKNNKQRQIKNAKRNLDIQSINDSNLLYGLVKQTYKRQNMKPPYSYEVLRNLFSNLRYNNNGKILIAYNTNHEAIAGVLFIWDNNSIYYLIGGNKAEYSNIGAMSLLLWEGILLSVKMNLNFDFEGSMKESIEGFFRDFGGEQKPYFVISKIGSKKANVLLNLKTLLTGKRFL